MRENLRRYRIDRIWSSISEANAQIGKMEGHIEKAAEFLLAEEKVFQNYWPNDHFFSSKKVKRYDQAPDDRRDNEQRATYDEWDDHLPDERNRREEYLYKSSREIERDERRVIACHAKTQMAELRDWSNSDEGDILELEGRHSPIEETVAGLRKIRKL
jgi:hypothetical protein